MQCSSAIKARARVTFTATLLLVTVAGLSGIPSIASAVEKTELVIWRQGTWFAYESMIEEFEKANPDISVRIETISGGAYFDRLAVAASTGSLPDLFLVNGPDVPAYAEGGFLRPLSDIIDPDVVNDWVPVARMESLWKGEVYAVPLETNAQVLAYNKGIFNLTGVAYPDKSWTWDDLTRVSSRMTTVTSEGIVTQYGLGLVLGDSDYTVWMNLPIVQMTGTDVLNDAGEVILDPALTAKALRFLQELTSVYDVVPRTDMDGRWHSGTLAMVHRPASSLRADLQLGTDQDYGFTLFPRPADGRWASGSGGWQVGANPDSKHPDAVARFLQFFADMPSVVFMAVEMGRTIPVRLSAFPIVSELARGQDAVLARYPFDVVMDAIENGIARPRTIEWPRIMSTLGQMFGRNWNGSLAPEQGAQQAVELIRELQQSALDRLGQ